MFVALFCLVAVPSTSFAQGTGRYGGTTPAGQAFSRGQASAAQGDRRLGEGDSEGATDAYEEAAGHYREALGYDANYEEARERLAYVLYVLDEYDDAVEMLETGLALNAQSLPLRRMMGIVLYEMGRLDEAVELLEHVVAEGGGQADVLFVLGKHYYENRAYDRAIEYFQSYLVDNPSDAATHGALGNAYLRTEQYEMALVEFRSVLELDPENLTAQTNMGDVHFASGDFARAIEIYERVLPRDSENYRIWFNAGKSYLELGRNEEALAAFERLAELRDDLYQAHYFRGVALAELGRPEDARQAFRRSVALSASHALSYYRLGLVEAELDNLPGARDALERARTLQADEAWFALALGNVHRRQANIEGAIEQHLAAIRIDDSQAPFQEALGLDYFAAGRLDEAITALETSQGLEGVEESASNALATALLHRAAASLRGDELEAAEADLQRAAALGHHPLELALAQFALAERRDDDIAAAAALDAVATTHAEVLPYRRARAYLALRAGQPSEVSSLLADVDAVAPEGRDARDAALLGHAAAAQGNWQRALTLFEEAAEVDEGQRSNIALSQLELGLQAADRRRWTEAETYFDRANGLRDRLESQDAARLEYARAVTSLNLESYSAAERQFSDALRQLERIPTTARTRLPSDGSLEIDLRMAYAMYRNGHHAEALTQLERVRGEGADDLRASAHERLSRDAYDRGDLREARRHLEEAIASAPRNAPARNNLACLMYGEGDVRDAGEIFQALAGDGIIEAAIFNYAVYLDEQAGDPEEAYRYYLRYLEHGGEGAEQARERVRIKEDVFGFDSDG